MKRDSNSLAFSSIDRSWVETKIAGCRYVSLFSELYHLLAYSIERPDSQANNCMFIVSIDVDVGAKELGTANRGTNDRNVNRFLSEHRVGEIEEMALPLFASLFDDFELPVTFAIRGQLTEVNDSVLDTLLNSSVEHDLGAHGYYHREFTGLSREEADRELEMISTGMKKFNTVPRSFVYPKNSVAYLDLLEKHGYQCYRGYGDFMKDRMCIEREGRLFNIHPSLYLSQNTTHTFPKRILDIAITRRLPFHVWFHLWSFGDTNQSIQKAITRTLFPLVGYAKKKERSGLLSFETMLSAARKSIDRSNDAKFSAGD